MKKTIKLAVVAALALGATSAFATNGTSLIGYGAKSRAMGGTGVAQFQGAESGFNNPALLGYAKGNEGSIGGTYFDPTVTFDNTELGGNKATSDAAASIIPAVSLVSKVNDNFAWGLAMYGVGGMGVDYREATNGNTANDMLMLMRLAIPLAYTTNNFSVGFSPVIEYGLLAMNNAATGPAPVSGTTSDIALGFELGLAYEISGVTLGLDYKSAVTHDFKNTFISADSAGNTQSELDTPAVIALGVSYNFGANTIALDYKNIQYSSAKGLEDFNWDDQNVVAVGYEYATDKWAARLGYNYGAQPIQLDNSGNLAAGQNTTMGSLAAFPAVTESHYTIGGSYSLSEKVSIDAAYIYATGDATSEFPMTTSGGKQITATNDQTSLTVAANFKF